MASHERLWHLRTTLQPRPAPEGEPEPEAEAKPE